MPFILLFGVIALVPLFVLLVVFFGGVGGWVVGIFFPFVMDAIREASGLDLTNFEIGATFGFVSGFLKSSSSLNSSKS